MRALPPARFSKHRQLAVKKWLSLLVQFLPLSIFATYAYWNGTPDGTRWSAAFQLGAVMALSQLALLVAIKPGRPLNRLILGANLYLLLGGAAVTAGWWDVLSAYAEAMEAGILAAIIATGLISTVFTKSGFVGVEGVERRFARIGSAVLLVAAAGALLMSIVFKGDRMLAAVLPILGLAITQKVLAIRLQKSVRAVS